MRDVPRGDNRTPINNGVCVDDVKTMRGNRLSAKQGNGKVNREARKHFVFYLPLLYRATRATR